MKPILFALALLSLLGCSHSPTQSEAEAHWRRETEKVMREWEESNPGFREYLDKEEFKTGRFDETVEHVLNAIPPIEPAATDGASLDPVGNYPDTVSAYSSGYANPIRASFASVKYGSDDAMRFDEEKGVWWYYIDAASPAEQAWIYSGTEWQTYDEWVIAGRLPDTREPLGGSAEYSLPQAKHRCLCTLYGARCTCEDCSCDDKVPSVPGTTPTVRASMRLAQGATDGPYSFCKEHNVWYVHIGDVVWIFNGKDWLTWEGWHAAGKPVWVRSCNGSVCRLVPAQSAPGACRSCR